MRKISTKELATLEVAPRGRAKEEAHPVYAKVGELREKETLLVLKTDWDRDQDFVNSIHGYFKRDDRNFSVKTLADRSGWLVTRLS